MLEVTDIARKYLRKSLVELDAPDDVCLRIDETPERLRMFLDQQRPGDTTVKHGDEVLLVASPAMVGRLAGHTIDYNENTGQLVFT